jgi:peptidase M48-like protein
VTQELVPLAYHTEIAARLEALEPRGWAVFARAAGQPSTPTTHAADGEEITLADDLEAQLLRHAYRMEPDAHPRVHAAARRAGDALGVGIPITIYQLEGADQANAALAFRPGEALIALSGNLLALLGDEELVACFGHELAHHRLWSGDGSRLLVADRFLMALGLDAATPPSYLETGRRFDLATELYADRGSLLACGSLEVAISSLVKVATGLSDVDPAAYLRQAREAHPERGTEGATHPETVLRAWALERWADGDGDEAVRVLLAPGLDIERLDLVDRELLESLTRRLVMDAVAPAWMQTGDVTSHARQFLVDVRTSYGWAGTRLASADVRDAPAIPVDARVPAEASMETRRFLAYVLLDLATVDPDLGDESLIECLAVAREAGIDAAFEEVARKELAPNARTWEALQRRAADRRRMVVGPVPSDTPEPEPSADPPAAPPGEHLPT